MRYFIAFSLVDCTATSGHRFKHLKRTKVILTDKSIEDIQQLSAKHLWNLFREYFEENDWKIEAKATDETIVVTFYWNEGKDSQQPVYVVEFDLSTKSEVCYRTTDILII
jgi:hypothetical protein